MLKDKGIKCKSEKSVENTYRYGISAPLKTLGKFYAKVNVFDCEDEAEFINTAQKESSPLMIIILL